MYFFICVNIWIGLPAQNWQHAGIYILRITTWYQLSIRYMYISRYIRVSCYIHNCVYVSYGVATVSRIDKITGLFCRISSILYVSFAKETYNLIDPTNQSHPIVCIRIICKYLFMYVYICTYIFTREVMFIACFKGCFAHNRPGKSGCICIWYIYTDIVCKEIYSYVHIYMYTYISWYVAGFMLHVYMCLVTHVNVSYHLCEWDKSPVNESCRTYEWVMSSMWMSRVIYQGVMSHIWMSHIICVNESCHVCRSHVNYSGVMSHTWMSHVIYVNESCHL